MSKLKVGDRIRAKVGNPWVRKGDVGTVTDVDGDCILALWDRPLQEQGDSGWWVSAAECEHPRPSLLSRLAFWRKAA